MYLIVLVVNDPYQCNDLLKAWEEAGVPGATVIDSLGLQNALKHPARDNIPLMPNLEALELEEEDRNRTMFSVVQDKKTVKLVREATEQLLGPLQEHESGFMFVVAVSEAIGLWQK
jgi:nitrogen regulatory protein PII